MGRAFRPASRPRKGNSNMSARSFFAWPGLGLLGVAFGCSHGAGGRSGVSSTDAAAEARETGSGTAGLACDLDAAVPEHVDGGTAEAGPSAEDGAVSEGGSSMEAGTAEAGPSAEDGAVSEGGSSMDGMGGADTADTGPAGDGRSVSPDARSGPSVGLPAPWLGIW